MGYTEEAQDYKRSRPLHGESIYLRNQINFTKMNDTAVLVPSTGNLYIYAYDEYEFLQSVFKFSSPPRGIYISTLL